MRFKFYQGLIAECIAFAKSHFHLNSKPKGSDITRRASAEQFYRATGTIPDELLNEPELPPPAQYLWQVFNSLSCTRQNGMSINPITFQEIQAYCNLHKSKLVSWELDAIQGIDGAFMASILEESTSDKKSKS